MNSDKSLIVTSLYVLLEVIFVLFINVISYTFKLVTWLLLNFLLENLYYLV